MFERLLKMISKEDLAKIGKKKILLIGVGGVGGFTLESLVRTGFKKITIVDGDKINISNLNRQIITNKNNIGLNKVDVAKTRAISINEDLQINPINAFLTVDNFKDYINEQYDYIIDACDDIKIKIKLIEYAQKNNIKIITCLGTGRKFDPTFLEITTLNKTFNDPLAKKLRYELKRKNITLNTPVVWSSENSLKTEGNVGSAIFVPASAGILLANYIFKDILEKE